MLSLSNAATLFGGATTVFNYQGVCTVACNSAKAQYQISYATSKYESFCDDSCFLLQHNLGSNYQISATLLNQNNTCITSNSGVIYKVLNETYTDALCSSIKTFLNINYVLYNNEVVCEVCPSSKVSYLDSATGIVYCDDSCNALAAHLSGTPTLYNVLGACYIAGDSYLTGMAKYAVSGGDTYFAALCNQIQLYLNKAVLYNKENICTATKGTVIFTFG